MERTCAQEKEDKNSAYSINKYITLLEKLRSPDLSNGNEFIAHNLELFKIGLNTEICTLSNAETLQIIGCLVTESSSDYWKHSCFLFHILLKIKESTDLNNTAEDNIISIRQLTSILKAIKLVTAYGLCENLPLTLRSHPIFKIDGSYAISQENNISYVKNALNFFRIFLSSEVIVIHDRAESTVLEIMASILFIKSVEPYNTDYNDILIYFWEKTSKHNYFRNLLLIKSINSVPLNMQQVLHEELLKKLMEPMGFSIFVFNIMQSTDKNDTSNWRHCDIIARIVGHVGHQTSFYVNMIDQIFDFFEINLKIKDNDRFIGAGVVTLKRIVKNNKKMNQIIESKILNYFQLFVKPPELLAGLIIMDNIEFKLFLDLQFNCFCSISHDSLSPLMLTQQLPILLELYWQVNEQCVHRNIIKSLIVRCMGSLEKPDLQKIIESLIDNCDDGTLNTIHKSIFLNCEPQKQNYSVQICPQLGKDDFSAMVTLIKTLKKSNHNTLIYNVFMILLDCLESVTEKRIQSQHTALLQDDEVCSFVSFKFSKTILIMSCLTDIITHQPLLSQLKQNCSDILRFLNNFITKRIDKRSTYENNSDDSDHCLHIILTIFEEFLQYTEDIDKYSHFKKLLELYLTCTPNSTFRYQIEKLIERIEHGNETNSCINGNEFQLARSLLQNEEPYLRVYGIQLLIKLVNDKDEITLANKYLVLAIALNILQDEESYTFLNCIRLFTKLSEILEKEVLEALACEYSCEDKKVDFRLKVGEAMLKIIEEMGACSYKHKAELVNCFLSGCKSGKEEIRISSLSNMATLSSLLNYEIHNFFYELLTVMDYILKHDSSVSTRRAAAMVLSKLLWKIDLLHYQEYLLPIYRLLTFVKDNDLDEKTCIHATDGIKSLNTKCKKFLMPDEKIEKEIKIMGITNNKPKMISLKYNVTKNPV